MRGKIGEGAVEWLRAVLNRQFLFSRHKADFSCCSFAGRDQPQQTKVSRSGKWLKERTDENLANKLSRMTKEAEQRETRLRDDMEKLRIQQEQTLGTLDTRSDAMM